MTTSGEDGEGRREQLLARVREVFAGQEAELGTPEAPSQDGFLALARKGKDVWNAWRAEWPRDPEGGPRVDFRGVDFRKKPINFWGYVFGDEATFVGAQFGSFAEFSGAQFGLQADFQGAQFGVATQFRGARFGNRAIFEGTQFGYKADFDGAEFSGLVSFEAMTSKEVEGVWRNHCADGAVKERIEQAELLGLSSDTFKAISFRGAHFDGDVIFRNRAFIGSTSFDASPAAFLVIAPEGSRIVEARRTRFMGVPNFHGCTLHQDTVFEEESFENVPRTKEAAHAFRTLKLAMSKEQATREEQMFFRLEMDAERAYGPCWKKGLISIYNCVSRYGFSLYRPIVVWSAAVLICGLVHACLADLSLLRERGDNPHWSSLLQYVSINALPFPGSDLVQESVRCDLFPKRTACPNSPDPRPPDSEHRSAAVLVEGIHKTLSVIMLFLIGLALRNLFKMKG